MQNPRKKANSKGEENLILASGSPRRTQILTEVGIKHEVVLPQVDEITSHPSGPLDLVLENAKMKALEVSCRYPDRWVLGADTIVSFNEKVFGKPNDLNEAKEMLLSLSGKTHRVSTGVCLTQKAEGFLETKVESSEVKFKDLDEKIIDGYFLEVDPLDKAGAYGLQTRADLIIEKFSGSKTNVIGLPIELIEGWLLQILTNSSTLSKKVL
jgi:septum formation protein